MINSRQRVILFRILMVIYLAAVAYVCFGKFEHLPDVVTKQFLGFDMDKVIHFLMFFPFPILGVLCFDHITRKPWHSILMVVLLFISGSVIAAATELIQGTTTYRVADEADFLADAIALAIASVIAFITDLAMMFRYYSENK